MMALSYLYKSEDFPFKHSRRRDDDVESGAACKERKEGKVGVKANAFCELLPTHSDLADDGLFTSGHFRR